MAPDVTPGGAARAPRRRAGWVPVLLCLLAAPASALGLVSFGYLLTTSVQSVAVAISLMAAVGFGRARPPLGLALGAFSVWLVRDSELVAPLVAIVATGLFVGAIHRSILGHLPAAWAVAAATAGTWASALVWGPRGFVLVVLAATVATVPLLRSAHTLRVGRRMLALLTGAATAVVLLRAGAPPDDRTGDRFEQELRPSCRAAFASTADIRVLMLGDSSTYGMLLDETQTYPHLVATILNQSGATSYAVSNCAFNAATSTDALAMLEHDRIPGPDIVTVYVGWNDDRDDPALLRHNLETMVRTNRAHGRRTILLSSTSGSLGSITPFNDLVAEVARTETVEFVDLALHLRHRPWLFEIDALHPNQLGQRVAARLLAEAIADNPRPTVEPGPAGPVVSGRPPDPPPGRPRTCGRPTVDALPVCARGEGPA